MTGPKKLQSKVAVITGGTTGIGLAAAQLFVKEGAYVFITGRRQKEHDEAVKAAIGSNVTGIQGDIAKLTDHWRTPHRFFPSSQQPRRDDQESRFRRKNGGQS
jgi:NAD(P)-dependent dehydrogenase (short-subunit alcohol dehydrogenase family)